MKEVDKVVEVPLERGVPDEHDYIFYGESDEMVYSIEVSILARHHGRRFICKNQDEETQNV